MNVFMRREGVDKMNILREKEVLDWLKLLNDYAVGNKQWDTDKEYVCESHPMMPFEQGLGFDCQCGGPGMSPYRPQTKREGIK